MELLALLLDALAIPVPNMAMKAIFLSDTLQFAVNPVTLALCVGVLTVCTGLAAVWPAVLAARLRPIVALGYTS